MIKIVQRYLAKRLLVAACFAMLAIYVPVTLLSVVNQLPRAAIFSELLLPSLHGIAPMIFGFTLPVIVAIAITWTYGELAAEGTLTILYSAGLSTLYVRLPALFVALIATMLGYVTTCFVAPKGATQLENALHVIENELSPSLIEPDRFYSMNGGRRVIQFHERLGKNWIAGVFLKEVADDKEERVFFARDAIFERHENESWIVMRDGYVQSKKPGDQDENIVAFTQLSRPTGLAGTKLPKRSWIGYFELNLVDFLKAWPDARRDPIRNLQWISDALQRFGIPFLTFVHSVLGLALVARWSTTTGRSSQVTTGLICFGILQLHTLIVIGAEYAGRQGMVFVGAIAAIIVVEAIVATILFVRSVRQTPVTGADGRTAKLMAAGQVQ